MAEFPTSLAERDLFGSLFFARLRFRALCHELLVMLAVNVGIEPEFRAQFVNGLRVGLENEIDKIAGVERAGDVGKIAFFQPLHLLNAGAFFFELAFEPFDDVVGAFFAAFGIEDEESFVSVFHFERVLGGVSGDPSLPLNLPLNQKQLSF